MNKPGVRLSVPFALFITVYATNVPSPLYVVYQHRYHFTSFVLTEVFGAFVIGAIVALLFFGQLSDQVGRKPVLLAGSGVCLLSTLIFLGSQGTIWLFVARAVQGLALGLVSSSASAAIVELEPDANIGRAAVINSMMFNSAGALAGLLTGFSAQFLPWKTEFPFVVLLVLNVLSIVWLLRLPEPSNVHFVRPLHFEWPKVPHNILGTFALASMTLVIGWSIAGVYSSLGPSITQQLLNVKGLAVAGTVLFVFNGIGGVAQLVTRRRRPHATMFVAITSALIGVGLIELAITFGKSVVVFFAATIFAGLANALGFTGSLGLVNLEAPSAQRGQVISAYTLFGVFAFSVPSIGVGQLTVHVGLAKATGVYSLCVVALSSVALVMLVRHAKTHQKHFYDEPAPAVIAVAPDVLPLENT